MVHPLLKGQDVVSAVLGVLYVKRHCKAGPELMTVDAFNAFRKRGPYIFWNQVFILSDGQARAEF